MTQTFTPASDLTTEIKADPASEGLRTVPSAQTIQTILRYSQNLEIKPSGLVQEVTYIKS